MSRLLTKEAVDLEYHATLKVEDFQLYSSKMPLKIEQRASVKVLLRSKLWGGKK